MTAPALVLDTMKTTGTRAAAAGYQMGVRYVRTNRGFALFDDQGRYVGRVEAPTGEPLFGPAADTVLLRRM